MVIQLAQRGELYMNRLAMPAQRGHSVSLFFFFELNDPNSKMLGLTFC
jgi:hypothetical protein